jgi:hypothetical protein
MLLGLSLITLCILFIFVCGLAIPVMGDLTYYYKGCSYSFKHKGDIKMKNESNIDKAIDQRNKVKKIEEELAKQKQVRDELKSKAKEDIEWILGNTDA